jgi:glutathionylspermidine amidase/synthetase
MVSIKATLSFATVMLACFFGFAVFASSTAAASSTAGAAPAPFAPFGARTGVGLGVPAFSNGDGSITNQSSYDAAGQYMGMKWQCVEYGRRSLNAHFGLVFGSVVGASDIWRFDTVTAPGRTPAKPTLLRRYPNYAANATALPAVGSLVIYGIQKDCPYGHVAVIVAVLKAPAGAAAAGGERRVATVRIAEENWANCVWPQPTWSRELHVMSRAGALALVDPTGYFPMGWMRVNGTMRA